eukprot:CAMPEP_0116133440 /NCGR_PEP_ID=MMETSP0329-20121206/10106_1 /TAXON_ID=697910 /ORGANISM="Pseudo-nitzschia arenysensis, Strain B593" /LENGTH=159 /DNA_ID=CAMNT_0003628069 /DNA_START=82 /DNA_END=561 /DNA_ORIENTATION=+
MTESIDDGKTEIITDDPNPLSKLIAGFCTPSKAAPVPVFDEDADADDVNNKYQADLTIQEPPADPVDPAPTPTETSEEEVPEESAPEEKVIANRRRYGIEMFVMALLFVVGTLLSLNKLGYTTSDMVNVVDKSTVETVEAEPVAVVEVEETEEEVAEEL